MSFKIQWVDRGREPQCPPDPRYPKGIDCDFTNGQEPSCASDLPYPAKRCGVFVVECETCGQRIAITTAGRHDDPRSVKFPCSPKPEKIQ